MDNKDVRTCSNSTHDSTSPMSQRAQTSTKKVTQADVLIAEKEYSLISLNYLNLEC